LRGPGGRWLGADDRLADFAAAAPCASGGVRAPLIGREDRLLFQDVIGDGNAIRTAHERGVELIDIS
jgi:hypothetical protein